MDSSRQHNSPTVYTRVYTIQQQLHRSPFPSQSKKQTKNKQYSHVFSAEPGRHYEPPRSIEISRRRCEIRRISHLPERRAAHDDHWFTMRQGDAGAVSRRRRKISRVPAHDRRTLVWIPVHERREGTGSLWQPVAVPMWLTDFWESLNGRGKGRRCRLLHHCPHSDYD
jgi:hypothetical protein